MNISNFCLTWFIVRALSIGITITSALKISKVSSIISFIISYLIGLLIIKKYNKKRLPKNKIYITLLIIVTFILSLICLKDLSYFIHSQFLYKTNIFLLTLFLLIPVLYTLNKGQNTFQRLIIILGIITMLSAISIDLFLIKEIDPNNYRPINGNPIKCIPFIISYNILPLFLIKINGEKINIKAYTISFLSIFIIDLLTIGIYGIELSSILKFPEFHLLKKIGSFTSKIEGFLSIEWLISIYVLLTYSIFTIKKLIKKTYKKKTNNILICFLLFILSNMYTISDNLVITFLIILPIFYLLPLLKNSKDKNSNRNKHNKN